MSTGETYIPPTHIVIGTCGLCGGPVTTPGIWGGVTKPPRSCARCGAVPAEHGTVLQMRPGSATRIVTTTSTETTK